VHSLVDMFRARMFAICCVSAYFTAQATRAAGRGVA
jgi:hypothetical protein